MSSSLLRSAQRMVVFPVRNISKSAPLKNTTPRPPSENPSIIKDGTNFKVNPWEKRFLLWTGRFRNSEQIPNSLPPATMEHARNKMRIRVSNLMMVASAIACLGFVLTSKNQARKHESMQKMDIEFERRINGEI